MLRPQQQELKTLVDKIKLGDSKVNEIFLPWTCGGGKSLSPVILSDLLIKPRQKQIVVVPRSALQIQGEQGYSSPYYQTDKIARIASNSGDPFRDCNSCFTTFQAIGANPEKWIAICHQYEIQLVLDEFHHLSNHGEWIKAIKEMKKLSSLTVFLTGTIFRGDNSRIPFVPYDNNNDVDYANTEFRQWIFYTHEQALKDGNVLPYQTTLIDGSGKYLDTENIERSFSKLGDKLDNLKCAFMSEYALHLLDLTVRHYLKFKHLNPWAKLLIVSPDIKTGKKYLDYLNNNKNLNCAIATSEDSKDCKLFVKRFKNGYYNCLVTVGIAYEGFDCVQLSHLALLTLIRSKQWLTQCLARVTRSYKDKKQGYIFAPQDSKMVTVLKQITVGVILSASNNEVKEIQPKKEGTPGFTPTIKPLSSTAHIDGIPINLEETPNPTPKETQSELETRLRKQINSVINKIVGSQSPGNRKVKERIFWLKVKQLVNLGRTPEGRLIKKPLSQMTVRELKKIDEFASNY